MNRLSDSSDSHSKHKQSKQSLEDNDERQLVNVTSNSAIQFHVKMENGCSCATVLGVLAFLLDTWFPWVFGYVLDFPSDNSIDPGQLSMWKIVTVIVVVVWSVSAIAALFYTCIPGRKVRFNIVLGHLLIAVGGSVFVTRNLLTISPHEVIGELAAILMLRLLHFIFVATYLRHLKNPNMNYSELN